MIFPLEKLRRTPHIISMKRRAFLQTTLAAMAMPMVPVPAAPAMSAKRVSVSAQLWASYFSTPGGQAALARAQSAQNLGAGQAKRMVMRNLAKGGFTPTVIAPRTARGQKPHQPSQRATAQRVQATPQNELPDALRNLNAPMVCPCFGAMPA